MASDKPNQRTEDRLSYRVQRLESAVAECIFCGPVSDDKAVEKRLSAFARLYERYMERERE